MLPLTLLFGQSVGRLIHAVNAKETPSARVWKAALIYAVKVKVRKLL